MMEAIPTPRDKAGKFLRPEMTTLEALRMLFWEDLPSPKEEEPPKLDPQMKLAGFDEEEEDEGDEGEEDGTFFARARPPAAVLPSSTRFFSFL